MVSCMVLRLDVLELMLLNALSLVCLVELRMGTSSECSLPFIHPHARPTLHCLCTNMCALLQQDSSMSACILSRSVATWLCSAHMVGAGRRALRWLTSCFGDANRTASCQANNYMACAPLCADATFAAGLAVAFYVVRSMCYW